MSYDFYNSKEYREKQSVLTRINWQRGIFNSHYKKEKKTCLRDGCGKVFEAIPSDPKVYCSRSCAAIVNNFKRGSWSEEVKLKISRALKGRKPSPTARMSRKVGVSLTELVCKNPGCQKIFFRERWMKRKFCCNQCAMDVIGRRPTSPRAARGKAGIRKDIDPTIYFYSRWEANMARLFNFLDIKWIHQPRSFDLGLQMYTPDFYLPDYDMYIEVKNFLWKYSELRDKKFRELYSNLKLMLILKKDYLKLEGLYSHSIGNWEYRNTKFIEKNMTGNRKSSKELTTV